MEKFRILFRLRGGGGSLIKMGSRNMSPPSSDFSSGILNQIKILIIIIIELPLEYILVGETAISSDD